MLDFGLATTPPPLAVWSSPSRAEAKRIELGERAAPRRPAIACIMPRMLAISPMIGHDASMNSKHEEDSGGEPGRAAGGQARAAALPAERRTEIARAAANARWAEPTKEAICGSPNKPLIIGDAQIECYVLDDGTRVLTQAAFLQALGRHPRAMGRRDQTDDGLPPILQSKAIKPYIPGGIAEKARPITFKLPSGARASGYNAELLPEVCEIYLAAREARALPPNQQHIAQAAEILVRGLARVGIIALVDEATGYQEMRTKNALEKILAEFVDVELRPYIKTFPTDFYKEMFRLRGLQYSADSVARPQYFGNLTNDVVYKRLAPGVLDELKRVQGRGSNGTKKHKLFQRLTQNVGYPKLREHLGSVVTLMKLSTNWDDFKTKLDELHPKTEGSQAVLPLDIPPSKR